MFTSFAYDPELKVYRDDVTGDIIQQSQYDVETYQITPDQANFTHEDYLEMTDTFEDFLYDRVISGLYYYLSLKGIHSGPIVDFNKFIDDIIKGKYPKMTRAIFDELEVDNPTFDQFDQLEIDLKKIGTDAFKNSMHFLNILLGNEELDRIIDSAYNILKLDNLNVQNAIVIIEDVRENGYISTDDMNLLLKYSDRPTSFVKPTELNEIFSEVFARFDLQKSYEEYLINMDLYSNYGTELIFKMT